MLTVPNNVAEKTNNQSSLRSLQVLRAIAATSVVYFHIEVMPRFGSFGVDIFFVISGFVMTMVIVNGQNARTFSINRIARIVPLYWIITTCFLLLAAIKPELLNSTTANLTNYIKSLFFIPYFKENGALHPMLAVGWTLNYEMFFYFCIWISIMVSRKIFLPLALILLISSYIVLGNLIDNRVMNAFFNSTLLFEFAFGMLIFYIYKRLRSIKIYTTPLIIIVLLSYCLMAWLEAIGTNVDRLYAYGLPSVALVLSLILLENSIFYKNNIVISLLVGVGNASYATYLSHLYVVELMRKIVFLEFNLIDLYTPIVALITLILALTVGQIIYMICDKPISSYTKKVLLYRL
jgi:exopolysaccharide production protein ExoZ